MSVERARDILKKSKNVDEARDVADRAKAIGIYMRARNASIDAQFDALEIQLRAERRIGELARGLGRVEGLKSDVRRRCRDLAEMPEVLFDEFLTEHRSRGELFAINAPLRVWERHKEADALGPKAAPQLVEAVRSGKLGSFVAKKLVNKPQWRQAELAVDPDAAYDAYTQELSKLRDARDREDPSDAIASFISGAESCVSRSERLVDLKVIPPTLHRQLVTAIEAVNSRARANRK